MRLIKYFIVWIVLVGVAFATGPRTRMVKAKDFDRVFYVSVRNGKDEPSGGSLKHPWQTLKFAIQSVSKLRSLKRVAIWVAEGTYRVQNLVLPPHLTLVGGFSTDFQQRDIFRFATILDGEGKNRILVAGNHTRIDGFIFQNGRIRGKGGAIYCPGVTATITNNIFRSNQTLMPRPWKPRYRHEIANDGGAIYCEGPATIDIHNNLFIENTTEVGRGAGIALHDHVEGNIWGNVFIRNVAGTKDPKRSSDGGAISIFKWSRPRVEENIILYNQAKNHNDAGGIFVALWSSPLIQNNILVANYGDDDGGALFVGGQEHRYDRPLDKMPPADSFQVRILKNTIVGNQNASRNSGAMRLTMQTRAVFAENVCAFNSGIYFQRSEVTIRNNVILDDFLCKETRKELAPYRILNNVFLGKVILTAPAEWKDNWQRSETNPLSNALEFRDDHLELTVWNTNFRPEIFQTELYVVNPTFQPGQLKGRVVQAGNQWGVIEDNSEHFIQVWGNLDGITNLMVLSTYRIKHEWRH